jgi:hypothetical protein
MDPIGFSFEHYDSIGRFSTEDHNGFAIDASGELEYTDDVNGPFRDALELSDRLAESDDVASCLATQAFRYAQGRRAEEEDACSLSAIRKHRKASIKDLLVSLTLTDGFRYRHTDNGD